jgi:hypothetical protein
MNVELKNLMGSDSLSPKKRFLNKRKQLIGD